MRVDHATVGPVQPAGPHPGRTEAEHIGLRKGLSLIRGMRRSMTEDQQRVVAGAIIDHLESHNWKIEHGPGLMLKIVCSFALSKCLLFALIVALGGIGGEIFQLISSNELKPHSRSFLTCANHLNMLKRASLASISACNISLSREP
jgi:hypothetical protein